VGGLKARIQARGPNEFAMTVSLLGVHAAEAPYDPSIASDRRAFRLQSGKFADIRMRHLSYFESA